MNKGQIMTELLTAAQMRAIEAAAIASGEVTGLELMERAGRGVVEAIFEEWPELAKTSHRAVVLCGPGNNGGDGFVVARLLKEWGWEVEVFLYGTPEGMPPDARVNYERWVAMGEVRNIVSLDRDIETDMLIDAIFGTGLTRPIAADLYNVFDGVIDCISYPKESRVVAVDVPSGLCSDSGRAIDCLPARALPAISVDLTVTFHLPKVGHYLDCAAANCGTVVCVDIGLGNLTPRQRLKRGEVVEWPPEDRVVHFEYGENLEAGREAKVPFDHKYSHGHALILSGPPGHGGAARLSARGALRIGTGLVTVACPHEALPENAARLDAIMLTPVHNAKELSVILSDTRINAIGLGPGLSVKRALMLVPEVLKVKRATVLDADALTAYADDPAKLFAMLHPTCILTPHAGEFARLFPDIAAKLTAPAITGPAYSKVDAAREAAARAGCVVLFKGPDTVIADPSGRCSINSAHYDRAAPWLATAGSGDVLAGFITGLLARGFAPMQAAETAAWLHVECARSFGPGLIAEDLPEELPKVFRALGL
jgi:ADP-dependent NAD(P)H-hydrate dehydratase / NAD(P)H-hydrate epimerase